MEGAIRVSPGCHHHCRCTKLKDADVNTYEKTLKYLNQCIPERFSSLDRRITIDALIRLGLTEEHLKNNENIQKELAKKFFSFDTEKKVTGFGSGIYEPLTDLGVMKQKLEEFFKVRSEFVKKYPL